MTVSDSQLQTVVQLADEYLARRRRGERTSVTEYVNRYPHLAGRIRDVFPLSAMMDELASQARNHMGTGSDAGASAAIRPGPPPAELGDYRILRELGRGGMGIVYEAEHVHLRRHVALKVLHAGGRIAPGHRERFEREARAAAMLHHTNIVPVFNVGEEDGTIFYAMQFIKGEGLDKVLDELRQVYRPDRDGSVPATSLAPGSSTIGLLKARRDSQLAQSGMHYWRSVARVGIQVADALEYAHEHGTLHRDIKPSNLLLDADGVVWVTDFGLARIEDEAGLTQSGEFVGTLRYMAPERFEGRCDSRSDVYSLGLTLYELATLRAAFAASSRHRLIQQVSQEEPPRPRSVNPAIPRDLETIVLKATAREPQRRYQTAVELRDDLARFVEGRPIAARRSSAFQRAVKWSKRRPLVAGLLAAVLLSTMAGVIGIAWQWREAESARVAAVQLAAKERRALHEKTQALEDADRANREALKQLGRQYEANGLRLLDRGEWHHAALWLTEALVIDEQLSEAEPAERQHWLELGRRRLANLWRGSPRLVQLKSFPSYRCHALTEDGSLCITDDGRRCHVWDVATGEELHSPINARLAAPHAVSPDGQRLLLFDSEGVRIHDLQSGRRLASFEHDDVMVASWACRGERIVALNLKGVLRIWDRATGRPVGPDRELGVPPVVDDAPSAFTVIQDGLHDPLTVDDALSFFTVSQDGERLAVAVARSQVLVFNVRTGELVSKFTTPNQAMGVALSADGEQLSTQSRVLQVWNVASAQQAARLEFPLITYIVGHTAAFSPDGRRIAFGDNEGVVCVRDVASGKDVFPPRVHAAGIHSVAFSPDGQRLVTAGHDAAVRVWDASNGQPLGPVLRHEESVVASFSSDGRRIVTATRSGIIRIWDLSSLEQRTALDGHRTRVIFALFSPDGWRLVTGGWDPTVRVWDLSGKSGKQTVPPLQIGRRAKWISLSDNGRLILVMTSAGRVQLWDAHTGSPAGGDDGGGSDGPPALGGFNDIRVAEIDPSGRFLLLGRDRQYGIFDRTAPIEESGFVNFGGDRDRALGGAFDSTGRRALVYSSDGSVHVVDVATREILLKRPPNPDHRSPDVAWAGFGAGQTEVVVALTNGTVERWGISTGRQLAEFEVNVAPRRVDVNRTGDRLVMGGWDHTFRVWDVAEGKPLTPLARHARRLEHIAFSPDGESFATASLDGTARVWDTATGQPLTPWLRHPIAMMGVFFRPDGREVVTGGAAGIVRLWPLAATDERPVSDLMQLARLYSARRIEPGAGSIPLTGPELERLFQDLRADARQ